MTTHQNGRGPSWTRENGRGFHFGIEAEYLLVEAETFRPLWHHDLEFEGLNAGEFEVVISKPGYKAHTMNVSCKTDVFVGKVVLQK